MPAAHPHISTLPVEVKDLRSVSSPPRGWALLVLVPEDHSQGTLVLSLTATGIHLIDDTFLLSPTPPPTLSLPLPPTPKR